MYALIFPAYNVVIVHSEDHFHFAQFLEKKKLPIPRQITVD